MAAKGKSAATFLVAFSVLILAGSSAVLGQAPAGTAQLSQAPGTVAAPAAPAAAAPNYPETAEGFNAQMLAAVDAYQKGDAAAGRLQLETFRLPDSHKWFADQFGADQGENLSPEYDSFFEKYLSSMQQTLEDAAPKKRKLNITVKPGTTQKPGSIEIPGMPPRKLTGLVLAKEMTLYNINFGITQTGKADLVLKGNFKATLWMDTYLYQDGAYRLVGHGAWPFWVWDDNN
jgi:hypothetical protein